MPVTTKYYYEGYQREIIDSNPMLSLAWSIAQIQDDNASLGWWRWKSLASYLLDNYDIKKKEIR